MKNYWKEAIDPKSELLRSRFEPGPADVCEFAASPLRLGEISGSIYVSRPLLWTLKIRNLEENRSTDTALSETSERF